MGWDDLKEFQLPDPERLTVSAQSASALSEKMIKITNYMVEISQYEPTHKNNVEKIKADIVNMEKQRDFEFDLDLANNFAEIPDTHKRNLNLQRGWILNKFRSKYQEYEDNLAEMRITLVKLSRQYNEIERRLKAVARVLDVGRTILSALKEELRNLDNTGV